MSARQDIRFWNNFLLITTMLHVIVLGLFVLARAMGAASTQHQLSDPMVQQAINERLRPPAHVTVAEQPPLQAAGTDAVETPDTPQVAATDLSGEQVFSIACSACHTAGIAGAPRLGDAAAWQPRFDKGSALLYRHAIEGFQGAQGFMPPKGGRTDLSDQSVRNAVDYMISAARK